MQQPYREAAWAGRDPGSVVSFPEKLAMLDAVLAEQGEDAPDVQFCNARREPLLIAHFPGLSFDAHRQAVAVFRQAPISVPATITVILFASQNVLPQAMLVHQLDAAGIPYVNAAAHIATADAWENAEKSAMLTRVLPRVRTDYALVLDGLDVLLCAPLDPIFARFKSYHCRVLLGATKARHRHWPVAHTGEGLPELGEFKYLNAGTAFGRTADLLLFYRRAVLARSKLDPASDEYHSEQFMIRQVCAGALNNARYTFDHRCAVFQNFNKATVVRDDTDVARVV